MDKKLIGDIIAGLFLSFKFFIIPLCIGVISFIRIFTIKRKIKNAGINYYKEPDLKFDFLNLSIIIIALILLLFILISGEWFVPMWGLGFIIFFLSEMLINKLYGNISGIYENGIIGSNKKLFKWKELNSYQINENNISGYFNNGNIFEYNNLGNIYEIKELFEKNKIIDRGKL
jgi:hypothetical protein